MSRNAAAKTSDVEAPTKITNIQKVGVLRFCEEQTDKLKSYETVDISPGETKTVPAKIWNRYKDRNNIIAMDKAQMVIGGLAPGQVMKTPTAQGLLLRAKEKELEEQRIELDAMKASLVTKQAELDRKLDEALGI